MPTVKIQTGPTVAPQTAQASPWSTGVPDGAFDNGAKGLIAGGQALMKLSDRIDDIALKDAKTVALDTQLRAQNDIREAQNEFLSRKGMAAGGVYKDAQTMVKDIMDGYASELQGNPMAAALFKASFSPHVETFLNGMSAHQRTEMDKAFAANVGASLEDAARTYAENYNTPGAFTNFKQQSDLLLKQLHPEIQGSLPGPDGKPVLDAAGNATTGDVNAAVRGNALKEQVSKGLGLAAQSLVAKGDYKGARSFLDTTRGEMVPELANKLDGELKAEEQRQEGDRLGTDLFKKGLTPITAGKELDKIDNSAVRDRARSQLSHLYSVQKQAEAEYIQNKTASTYFAVDKAPSLSEKYAIVQSLPQRTPNDKRVYMAAMERYNFFAHAAGINPSSDPAAYLALSQATDVGGSITTPQQLRANPAAARVAPVDLQHLEKKMAGQQELDESYVKKSFMLHSGYDQGDDPSTKLSQDQKAQLSLLIAKLRTDAVGTKQGKDKSWIDANVIGYVAPGENKSKWGFGLGRDMTYGEALRGEDKGRGFVYDKPKEGTPAYDDWARLEHLYPAGSPEEKAAMAKYDTRDRDTALRYIYTEKLLGLAKGGKKR